MNDEDQTTEWGWRPSHGKSQGLVPTDLTITATHNMVVMRMTCCMYCDF